MVFNKTFLQRVKTEGKGEKGGGKRSRDKTEGEKVFINKLF